MSSLFENEQNILVGRAFSTPELFQNMGEDWVNFKARSFVLVVRSQAKNRPTHNRLAGRAILDYTIFEIFICPLYLWLAARQINSHSKRTRFGHNINSIQQMKYLWSSCIPCYTILKPDSSLKLRYYFK